MGGMERRKVGENGGKTGYDRFPYGRDEIGTGC